MEKLIKSKSRVKEHAEVFTPRFLVDDMLDLIPKEMFMPDRTFLEPSCWTWNFLIVILERKIAVSWNSSQMIKRIYSSIYGVDIQEDNVIECRERLLKYAIELWISKDTEKCLIGILERNIRVWNFLEKTVEEIFLK